MEWKTVMTNFMRLVIFLWIWVCIRRQKNNLRLRKNSILQDMIETCFMGSFSQNTTVGNGRKRKILQNVQKTWDMNLL